MILNVKHVCLVELNADLAGIEERHENLLQHLWVAVLQLQKKSTEVFLYISNAPVSHMCIELQICRVLNLDHDEKSMTLTLMYRN